MCYNKLGFSLSFITNNKMGIGRNHWIFQQDNDPKHTTKITKEFQLVLCKNLEKKHYSERTKFRGSPHSTNSLSTIHK